MNSGDRLGEGPCWSPAEGRLYWFDIKGRALNWHEPASGRWERRDLGLRASAAAVREAGGLLLATEQGLALWDPRGERLSLVQPMALEPGFRTNDGKVDPHGDFWWSTMDDDDGRRPGTVYRTRASGQTEAVISPIHIANTMSFSPDGLRLYLADSRAQAIYAYDMNDLSQRTEFAHTRGEAATPDGGAVDAQGFLWNAQWGGGRLVRYAPDGRIDLTVQVPVDQPTSCAFGGPGLRTLFVTSAWDGLSPAERRSQPLAGALFAFQPDVGGLPLPLFAGAFPASETLHDR
ncbi:SMP-30/gluconolactonase/LRE family protein [Phenylobacterium sp.]|uniref:SMP-30/gluconolactonase/LRE family protein n=1 Tax=Phenylobacterium sp. TaxID=1871053 RepID=UPI00286A452C|nr:SMP-30/gluconolactonase/LRE family protein [Phenylobacterium sp.]